MSWPGSVPAAAPVPGPGAEPSPGPGAEPSPGPAAEPSPGLAAEPGAGPAAEPGAGPAAEPGRLLVHGMGTELAEPDWSPLTGPEVRSVLAHYPGVSDVDVTWRSPRPMSAAGLVRRGGQTLFVKRHDVRVRTVGQLAAEHAFAAHLRAHGVPVPEVLRTRSGHTTVAGDGVVYEVHRTAPGLDLYRDAMSWTPFTSLGHARAAGAALARLHRAAASFHHTTRPPAVLTSSCAIITAADPVEAIVQLAARRPGLGRYLAGRHWQDDLTRHHLPVIRRAAPLLAAVRPHWAHGDWHPSNLTWTSAGPDAEVAGCFDFGLANRTFVAHDLAIALERSTVSWLDPAPEADLDAVDALLDGYGPADPPELAALAEVLPVAHLEYALSETEYFAAVVHSPANVTLAYDGYLVGHTRWFEGPAGSALLDHLRRRTAQNR